MPLTYQSGEDSRRGDHVTWAGKASSIEDVVEGLNGDSGNDWLFENCGTGVMVVEKEPTLFGRVYLHSPEDDEELCFVARGDSAASPPRS